MAKKNKVRLPSSQGGLVSYSDEQTALINISPKTIMIFVVIITVSAILVRLV